MPRSARLLVLGDSVSASTGACFRNYLDLVVERWYGDVQLEVINPSVAGLTTADARIVLDAQLAPGPAPDVVLIYLGNCDACGFGFLKSSSVIRARGRWPQLKDRLYKRLNPLSVRLAPFRFTEELPLVDFRECVSASDFVENLARLVARARRAGSRVVLVNPAAKETFIPCNNLGNFIFYKIFGVDDDHQYHVDADQSPLEAALRFHSDGEHQQAAALYNHILRTAPPEDEARAIAINNRAAIRYAADDAAGAIAELEAITTSDDPMAPIVHFNRALALSRLGRHAEARQNFAAARSLDYGTFRIKRSYSDGIAALARRLGDEVELVDLTEVLADEDFCDYCHPTEQGHEKVARLVTDRLRKLLDAGAGDAGAVLHTLPINPDVYLGFPADLFEYFGLVRPPREEFVDELLAEQATAGGPAHDSGAAKRRGSRGRQTVLGHPVFGTATFLRASPPNTALDQGRVPEFYAVRHLLRVYDALAEALPEWLEDLTRVRALIPDPSRLRRWLKPAGLEELSPLLPVLAGIHRRLDSNEVLARTKALLADHLRHEPTVFNRYRTISYWFFRESLIFGSASHFSCYFDRLTLSRVIDSCLFMRFHAADKAEADTFDRVLELVERVLGVHETHLTPVAAAVHSLGPEARRVYTQALRRLLDDPVLLDPIVGRQRELSGGYDGKVLQTVAASDSQAASTP